MAGLADLLYLGQPDPARQIALALSGQSQPGSPAQGAGPQGSPPPSPPANGPAPTPNAPPPQQPPLTPGAQPPPGSQPQPMAYQSSPDMASSYSQLANPPNLMNLYLQLQQRQNASDQINRGFALIAANHAGNPAMMRNIMDSVGGGANAGQEVQNLMSLYGAQQQMAAQQQLLGQAPAIAAKLGMDEGTVRAEILAGRGPDLIKSMEPTDLARNYQWARDTYTKAHPGASPDEIEAGAQSILLGAGGGGALGGDMRAMNMARSQWLKDPANQGKDPPGYMTDLTKWKIFSQDLSDAKTQFGGVNDSLNTFIGHMGDVANNPSLDKITGSTGGILSGAIQGLVPGEVNNLKTAMTGLGNEAKDMASRGGPKGVNQNLKTLGSSPDDFTNASLTNYRDTVIAPRMRQALQAQANANGAAGQANNMPGYLKLYMDQMYQPGGDLDIGGSPKAVTPDVGPDGKPLKPPNDATIAAFKNDMEHYGPEKALEHLKAQGFDTSKLR